MINTLKYKKCCLYSPYLYILAFQFEVQQFSLNFSRRLFSGLSLTGLGSGFPEI